MAEMYWATILYMAALASLSILIVDIVEEELDQLMVAKSRMCLTASFQTNTFYLKA